MCPSQVLFNDLCFKQVFRDSTDCTNTHYSVCICSVTPQISAAFMPAQDKLYDKEGLAGLVLNCSADSWHIMRFLQPLSGCYQLDPATTVLSTDISSLSPATSLVIPSSVWNLTLWETNGSVRSLPCYRPEACSSGTSLCHLTPRQAHTAIILYSVKYAATSPAALVSASIFYQQLVPLRKPPQQRRKTT